MFDPYHKWLGIAREEQPPTHYRLLGINVTETDREVIEEAAIRQTTHVRTNQLGPHAAACTRLLNEIGHARATLLDPARRREYDATLAPKPEILVRRPETVSPGRSPPRGNPWLWAGAAVGVVVFGVVAWSVASLLLGRTDMAAPANHVAAKLPKSEPGPDKVPSAGPSVPKSPQASPGANNSEKPVESPKSGSKELRPGPKALGESTAKPLVPDQPLRRAFRMGKGSWRIEGEHLVSDAKPSMLLFGDPQWKDYDFSFAAERLTGELGFAAIFRNRHPDDQKDQYIAVLPARANNGFFHLLQQRDDGVFYQPSDKKGKGLPARFAGKDFPLEHGREYKIRISVRDAVCECFFDDKSVLKYAKLEHPQGGVGFRNVGAGVMRIRDVLVRGAGGQVLWQGLPTLE